MTLSKPYTTRPKDASKKVIEAHILTLHALVNVSNTSRFSNPKAMAQCSQSTDLHILSDL